MYKKRSRDIVTNLVKMKLWGDTLTESKKRPIVVIGIGEIGSVFARGFLRLGATVIPVTRQMDIKQQAEQIDDPEAVIVAVGESELQSVLSEIPKEWKDRLVLIQNELLPRDWNNHQLYPTVISVWFEKKKGQDVKIVVPSPVFGKHAVLISNALSELDIPTVILDSPDELVFELLRKNFYILTSNIAGLKVGGTVGELWRQHQSFAEDVVTDITSIQQHLVGYVIDKEKLTQAMLVAFDADPDHGCMGRSAPMRLQRALDIAQSANIEVPTLAALQ